MQVLFFQKLMQMVHNLRRAVNDADT